jgi:hypothetical protein
MKMNSNLTRLAAALAAVAVFTTASARAADLTQKAREILAHSQDSFIAVSALSKMDTGSMGLPIQIGGLGEAQETTCGGLVIDASGLTVVAYSALNPMEKLSQAIHIKVNEEEDALKTSTELSRIQMRLPDGTEVPARLVLKDKELDLAFLVPETKEGEKPREFTAVRLGSASAKELDDIVAISRHGKDLGYQPTVTLGQITSVIKKPRPMYDLSITARPGAPIFLPDGQLLGLTVTFSGGGGGLMSMGAMEALVLPVDEITKLAAQARKAAEKKPAGEAKSDKQ